MAQVCEDCKKWCKEQYWNQLPASKHHFFKIMMGDFRNKLRVPKKFMSNFRGELLRTVILKGPSGNTWKTDLVETEDDFILVNGWESFAKDHNLIDGDFLVFKYSKDSTFDVLTFDPSGCEKEISYFVKGSDNKHPESCCSIQQHTDQSEVQDDDWNENEDDEDDEEDSATKKSTGKMSNKNEGKRSRSDENIMYPMPNRRAITAEDRGRAYSFASRHSTKRPSSKMIILKRSHVVNAFILTVPKNFAVKYLPKKSQTIKLRVPPSAKTWDVLFNTWKNQYTFTNGWAKFVLENNLEVQDICILELAQGTSEGETLLDVYIYRAVEEVVPMKVVK